MDLERRINAFLGLAERLKSLPDQEKYELFAKAKYYNPWFTMDNLELAWCGLLKYLDRRSLEAWLAGYAMDTLPAKRVGVVMAGNIPMVGIHDFICVLISGHTLVAKLSSQDEVLIKFIAQKLIEVEPGFSTNIFFADKLKDVEAVIATGSDNTARYFHYYFSKYPHIIRKNRTSVAVLTGQETPGELTSLGDDMFTYFGMGCRNISKVFLPEGISIDTLFRHWSAYSHLADHHKYANNYHYQRSIMMVNLHQFIDSGFAIFVENPQLVSPLGVVYYEYYTDLGELKKKIAAQQDKLQCIISRDGLLDGSKKFGTAQTPDVSDYADNVDTLQFLISI